MHRNFNQMVNFIIEESSLHNWFLLFARSAHLHYCLQQLIFIPAFLAKITSSSIPFTNDTWFLRDIAVCTRTHLHIQTCTRMDSTQHNCLVGIAHISCWLLFNADPTEYAHPSSGLPTLTTHCQQLPPCISTIQWSPFCCLFASAIPSGGLLVRWSAGCMYTLFVFVFTCRLRVFSFLLTSQSPANSVSMETWGRVCQGDVCFLTPCVQRDTNYLWVTVCNCIMHMHVWFCWKLCLILTCSAVEIKKWCFFSAVFAEWKKKKLPGWMSKWKQTHYYFFFRHKYLLH